MKIKTLVTFLALSCALPGLQAAVIVANATSGYTAFSNTPPYTSGNSITDVNGTVFTVGELDNIRMERGLVRWTLPGLDLGESITNVTLRLYVTGVTNGGALTNASLYWSNDSQALSTNNFSSYFQNTTFQDTGLYAALTTTTAGTWIELDVTSYVSTDYSKGTTHYSYFRIQANGVEWNPGGGSNRYGFGNTGGSFAPQLVITTVPEPSTAAMIMGSSAIALLFVRSRKHGAR